MKSAEREVDSLFKPFKEIYGRRHEIIQEYKGSTGKKVMGYLCSYVPVEIIHAAGFFPVRLGEGFYPGVEANRLLPSFVCPYLRSVTEFWLQGNYRYLDGLVHAYTCDAACGFFNIWRRNSLPLFSHIIYQPYLNEEQSVKYYYRELQLLIGNMQGHFGVGVEMDQLAASVNLYRSIRTMLKNLYDFRRQHSGVINGEEMFYAINAGYSLPPEEYLRILKELVNSLVPDRCRIFAPEPAISITAGNTGSVSPGPGRKKVPVILSGSYLLDPELYGLISSCGGVLADDELCNGRRSFDRSAEPEDQQKAVIHVDEQVPQPLREIIIFYRSRPACAARVPARQRLLYLVRLAREVKAAGIIFAIQKFCDPHLADLPLLTAWLKEAGFPSLILEYEGRFNQGAVVTRLQAFFEMLGGTV